MSKPRDEDVQATFAATLVDEWVRGGLRHAVICPGSRGTPLALALAEHPALSVQIHHDERSAGFLALGLGVASGRAATVLTTSGTAAAELHPAVVEAHYAGVPMLVCTADRPPELRDVGAPQTIDQTHLFGHTLRWYADPGVADDAAMHRWRAFASRALAETEGPPPGPVHLNLPFREPLVGTSAPLPPARQEGPWAIRSHAPDRTVPAVEDVLGHRGIILAGEGSARSRDDGDAVIALASTLGWPVVADPRSCAWVPGTVTVAHLDGMLRSQRARTSLRPEVILRLGAPPASRVVMEWCADSGAREIVASAAGWSDPGGVAAQVLRADPVQVVRALQGRLSRQALRSAVHESATSTWLEAWVGASRAASEALQERLSKLSEPTEPAAARAVVAGLPTGAWLVVSSSMPVRDVERYAEPRAGLRIVANRGANGIDGVVSTAVGVAAGSGRPTGLLIGDLAFIHDSNGLLGVADRDVDLVAVVVDNDGGGIFSFLPQANSLHHDRFEQLLGTPHGLDLVELARAYGVPARAIGASGPGALAAGIDAAIEEGGVHVLVVRTDRAANVDIHRELDQAVAGAVETSLAKFTWPEGEGPAVFTA
jgi:2-succinyl-5-enolpyruvyl-6-hydroxy-3-cyclohexene-1-carboxylate synthase